MTAAQILKRTGEPHFIPVIGMSLAAAALFLLGVLPPRTEFVVGLGFVTGLALYHAFPDEPKVVLGSGFCGAYTTFGYEL